MCSINSSNITNNTNATNSTTTIQPTTTIIKRKIVCDFNQLTNSSIDANQTLSNNTINTTQTINQNQLSSVIKCDCVQPSLSASKIYGSDCQICQVDNATFTNITNCKEIQNPSNTTASSLSTALSSGAVAGIVLAGAVFFLIIVIFEFKEKFKSEGSSFNNIFGTQTN